MVHHSNLLKRLQGILKSTTFEKGEFTKRMRGLCSEVRHGRIVNETAPISNYKIVKHSPQRKPYLCHSPLSMLGGTIQKNKGRPYTAGPIGSVVVARNAPRRQVEKRPVEKCHSQQGLNQITGTDMTLWQQYLQPKTVTEALDALAHSPESALLIAGGTDLLLDLDQGRHPPVHTLVDVNSVREMLPIEIRGDELFIGASVPHSNIVASSLVAEHAQALIEACNLIGGPQVRNTATLGGNVAHALPAADGTIALMALNAQAEIASSSGGARRVPLKEIFLGPGKNTLAKDELLIGFYLPLKRKSQASAFERIMRPQGVALPIINMAIWLARDQDQIADVRIAVGPAGPKPWRASSAESILRGRSFDEKTAARTLELLLQDAQFRTSPRRASADYRRHLVSILFKDTLQVAWNRAL